MTGPADDPRARAAEAVAAADCAPENLNLRLAAAEFCLRAGDVSDALRHARQAVALDRGSARALRTLSGFLQVAGDPTEAIRVARQAIEREPANPELRRHIGGLLAAEGRWREAAEHLATYAQSGVVSADGWRLLSTAFHQAGNPAPAIDAARLAVAGDPAVIEYRLHLGSLLAAAGQFEEALEVLLAAREQAPDNALVRRVLSSVYAEQGNLGDALREAERAKELAPDDAACAEHLHHVSRLCAIPTRGPDPRAAPLIVPPRRLPRPPPPRDARRATSFWQDLAIRWRVIYAILLREIRTQFGHSRIGYVWAILEPLGHLATLGVVFARLNHAPPPVGDNLFLFYATGLMPYLMFAHISYSVMHAASPNDAMLQLPVVKRTDVMMAQALRQIATELCVGIIVFSVSALLGERGWPSDILTAMQAIGLLALLGLGIGAVNFTVHHYIPSYLLLYDALIRLLYFGSGIYYTPILMPAWVRAWLVWNPVLQGVEYFRSAFFPQYQPHWLHVGYLATWVVATIVIGFALERATRARREVFV